MTTFLILLAIFVVLAILITLLGRRSPSGAVSVATSYPRAGPNPASPSSGDVEGALALLATCVRPRAGLNLNAVVGVHVTDHVPADWHYALADGACSLERGPAGNAAVAMRADTRTWLALANKQVSFTGAAMNGSLRSDGDASVLIRLDDEFAGSPDPSRVASTPARPSDAGTVQPTTESASGADASGATLVRFEATGPARDEIIRVARESAHLSPEERRAAILNALQHKLEPGAEVHFTESSELITTSAGHLDVKALQAAMQRAMEKLPPGATREQKVEAMRAALREVPNAQHLEPFLDLWASSDQAWKARLGGKVAGALLTAFLDGLSDGG